jgi:hypothetical protein
MEASAKSGEGVGEIFEIIGEFFLSFLFSLKGLGEEG